jgi:hypothetical protein
VVLLWPAVLGLALVGCRPVDDQGVKVFNSDPTVSILSHTNGDRVLDGVATEFRGVVGDNEDAYEDLRVTWLLDGAIMDDGFARPDGTAAVELTLSPDDGGLVSVEVRDSRDAAASATVSVEVLATSAPSVSLDQPGSDINHYADVAVFFSGRVSDAEAGPDELQVTWESETQGQLDIAPPTSSGVTEGYALLVEGDHIIKLTATDPQGNTEAASTFITVLPPNTAPSCAWTAPEEGGVERFGEVVLLQGEATDAELDNPELQVTFTSSLDGELGEASPDSSGAVTLATSALSAGTHTVTLTVLDDVEASCTANRTFTVGQAPTVRITAPTAGTEVDAGDTVDFAGTATDAEDAATALAVSWESDLDGVLDSASPAEDGAMAFSRELSVGTHRITLTATDSDGFSTSTISSVEVVPCEYFYDGDLDGYGDPTNSVETCDQPVGYIEDGTDCDDSDPEVYPGADEYCDGEDDDCDGAIDESDAVDATSWYSDSDGDGYGDPATATPSCSMPSSMIDTGGDCDDADAAINPGAEEVCGDGVDDDCSGADLDCILDIPLATTDLRLWGESARDEAGDAVAGGGDVDGDGYDDVLVGAWLEDASALSVGVAYLVRGVQSGDLDLSSADARMYGASRDDWAGSSVAIPGDVNGDGYDDILVGAPGVDDGGTDAGAAYLLLGPVSGDITLTSADYVFTGETAGDAAGTAVEVAGDWDADGKPDLLIGAHLEDSGASDAGRAYLVRSSELSFSDLGDAWASFEGELSDDQLGRTLGRSGDFDGDGLDDLLMGAPPEDTGGNAAGAAYIMLGTFTGGTLDLRYADMQLYGEGDGHFATRGLDCPGDLDGDGYDDILVGADGEDSSWTDGGAVYIYEGGTIRGTKSLSGAVTKFVGEADLDYVGYSAAGLGDLNGDGELDLGFGVLGDDAGASDAGAVYVAMGPFSAGTIDMTDVYARLTAASSDDGAGHALAPAGDFNNDGYDDVLVGVPGEDYGGSDAGAAFVTFGALSW